MLRKLKRNRKEITTTEDELTYKDRKISIDWGRQGGVIFGYILIGLCFYGFIANIMMVDKYGNGISYFDMDRSIIFWTYRTFFSSILPSIIFILIFILLSILIIIFSIIIDWHSSKVIPILAVLYIIFVLDLYWNLFDIITVFTTGAIHVTVQSWSIVILFIICFGLTYKEDIPQYGIKASLWMVPFILGIGIFFYTSMFSFSDFFIFLFSPESFLNVLFLILTVLSGSLSGMKLKQERKKRRGIAENSVKN